MCEHPYFWADGTDQGIGFRVKQTADIEAAWKRAWMQVNS